MNQPAQQAVSTYQTLILADGPVAYWRMDEASGSVATDASGNARSGTYLGGYTLGQGGAIAGDTDTAVLFNGSTGYVQTPFISIFGGGSAFTVEAWITATSYPGASDTPIFCIADANSNGQYVQMMVRQQHPFIGFYNDDYLPSNVVSPNVWHHLVFVWEGPLTRYQRIYLDGVQCGAGRISSNPPNVNSGAATGNGSWIGRYGQSTTAATLDEIAIYAVALSPAQVTYHYQTGIGYRFLGTSETVAQASVQGYLRGNVQLALSDPNGLLGQGGGTSTAGPNLRLGALPVTTQASTNVVLQGAVAMALGGDSLGQASTAGVLTVLAMRGTTVAQATLGAGVPNPASITWSLLPITAQASASQPTMRVGPSISGAMLAQAVVGSPGLFLGAFFVSGTIIALGQTTASYVALTKIPLSGVIVTYASSTGVTGQANAAIIDLGVWPAGQYELKTICRTDAGSAAQALVVAVTSLGVTLVTSPMYATGDVASASYPTAYANYAAKCGFNLNAASDVVVTWSNPGSYHNSGKHLWIKGIQLHRTS